MHYGASMIMGDLGVMLIHFWFEASSDSEKVIMAAMHKRYQHTMGNNIGPVFLDLLTINKYYKCTGMEMERTINSSKLHKINSFFR